VAWRAASRPPSQARGQRLAVDQLQDQRRLLVAGRDVVDGRDARVRQRGDGTRLGRETAARGRVGQQMRVQQLDGNRAVELLVVGTPYLGTAATGDQASQTVAAEHAAG